MAMAEDGGSPSNNVASCYGGGGAGGKFRKKPFRKQPTPYDRPPTAIRGINNGGGSSSTSSWMTKLFVDPAWKLISYGADRFFSSVLRKRLPPSPPPQPPEVSNDVNEEGQGAVLNIQESAQEPAGGESCVPTNPRSNGIYEFEQLLKQKTFSRSEITHLTKLLQSKAVEVPAGDDFQKNEVTAFDFKRHGQFGSSPLEENRKEGIKTSADMLTPVRNSEVVEDDATTPAELAKAYTGGRPSKGSSSVLGVQLQGGTADIELRNNRPFTSKMPLSSLTKKTSVGVAAPDNGFITPRSRGRSAIYNMARTPYSRVHPTSVFKGSRSNDSDNAGPSVSSLTLSPLVNEEKMPMTLKRRSSVLDDEIGFIGSIQRTRQKPNLLASRNPGITRGVSIGPRTKQKLQLIGEPSNKVLQAVGKIESESAPITSHARVPSKSSEVAAKIFQHLEKLTPKEKSSESKLVAAREKSPIIKSTSDKLSGHVLRSMEGLDYSSKLLMCEPHDNKLGGTSVATLPNNRDGSFQKPRNIEENEPKESVSPSGRDPVLKNDSAGSLLDSLAATKTTDFIVENGTLKPPPEKRAFRMRAQEDSCELDDELHSNGLAPPADSNSAPAEVPKLVRTTTLAAEEATAVSQSAVHPFSVATEKPLESTGSPVFNFSPQVADKFPALSSESNKKTEYGFTSSSSLFNVSASTGSQLKIPELDKSDHPSPPKAGDISNKCETVSQVKWPHVSSFTPASDHINETYTGRSLTFTSSISNSNLAPTDLSCGTSTTTSGNFGFSAKPSNLAGPDFKIGNSVGPTSLVPAASESKISELAETKTKADTNLSPGSSIIPNSSLAAPSAANPGSITFGLSPSVSHSAVHLQGSLFESASKSVESGTGTVSQGASLSSVPSTSSLGTVSEGTYALPVSLAPSPFFNMNGNTGSSLFSNPQVSTSSKAFSFGTSAPSADTTIAPSSGPTSSVFNVGLSPVSEGNQINSKSASTPSIFSFGFGSSSSSTTSAAGSDSSVTLPNFNIGGHSSVPVGCSTSGTSGIFNFSGNTSTSSAVNIGSSNTFASVFGTSWQSSASLIFGSSSTMVPSPGFSFGSSSTPSAATNTASVSFNSSAGVTTNPFPFNTGSVSASSSPSLPANQPVFGTPPTSAFGSSPENNELMNAEDSMAEDPVQSSAPSDPIFGQPSVSPALGFTFGSTVPSQPTPAFGSTVPSQPAPAFGSTVPSQPNPAFGSAVPSQPNPFMFASQQNQAAPQNPPFQPTGSLEFNAGGSFSLGSGGGGDKSGRRIVKPNRNKNRKR